MAPGASVPRVILQPACDPVQRQGEGSCEGPWQEWTIMVPHLLLLFPSVLAVSWSHQPWSPLSPGGLLLPPVTNSGPPVLPPGPRSLPLAPLTRPPRLPKGVLGRRRKWRRRRRYWRDPRAYQRFRGVRLLREVVPRRRQERREDSSETQGRSFVSNFRNLFGAPDHCLEEGRQYSCTFAPVCWLTGGVATPGIFQIDITYPFRNSYCIFHRITLILFTITVEC